MSLVIDACVALKWVLPETKSPEARSVLIGAEPLIAPDFLHLECANVLATHARRGDMGAAEARQALAFVRAAPVRLVPAVDYLDHAHDLSLELGRSAYDCLYLAVAYAETTALLTADGKFARAVLASRTHAGHLQLL